MTRSLPGRIATGVLPAALALLTVVGRVAAHGGSHDDGGHLLPAWASSMAVLLGIAVLAGSVYADQRDVLARRYADAGVAVGVVALLAGVALTVL